MILNYILLSREIFSFAIISFANFCNANFIIFNNSSWIDYETSILFYYSILDSIWIYYDPIYSSSVSKFDLWNHHLCTIILLWPKHNPYYILPLLLTEFTTFLLFTLKFPLPTSIRIKIKNILKISWPLLRIFGYPVGVFLTYNESISTTQYLSNPCIFSSLIIYIYNWKWTCDFLKINKNKVNYSSLLVAIPLLLYILPVHIFISIFLLSSFSFFYNYTHHSIAFILDHSSIAFTCLNFLYEYSLYNLVFNLISSITVGIIKYKNKKNLVFFDITNYIYIYTLYFYSMKYWEVLLLSPFIIMSLLLRKKYSTYPWHALNGIYLSIVSHKKFYNTLHN